MRLHLATLASACALSVSPCVAAAQAAQAEPEFAVIAGVAIDSIRGGYLRNATVIVDGTMQSTTTDSLGRFAIDSIIPGEHRLRVRHPLLDTLGVVIVTAPKKLAPLERLAMLISTPSPKTIISAKCSANEIARGPAAVLGTVFDADSGDPSAGATVTTTWSGLQVSQKGVKVVQERRNAQVTPEGMFRLCGLPNDLTAGIIAARGADTTASVKVDLSSGIAILALHLPASATAAAVSASPSPRTDTPPAAVTTKNGGALVKGRVTDASNKPVEGAQVQIEQDRLTAITSSDGTFQISGARAGTRTITVRKLGFEPAQTTVDLKQSGAVDVNLKLAKFVPILKTIEISALRNQALERNGFSARRHRGEGRFITPEEIARRVPVRVNDLLRSVPYLHFTRLYNGKDIVSGRPTIAGGSTGCVRYYVDNVLWLNTIDSPDEYYHPSDIGAIEVYPPNLVPGDFMAFSRTGQPCYVIVLWTASGLQLR
ncbi:MAG TPA: carboxypeptidase regulatory-like domain-containing protein [Gemmatimonadaceae bacterium]|nr:carboxypeptidase regulatory-like domain-containing protein [Gemmatimonadaceae bacterium]